MNLTSPKNWKTHSIYSLAQWVNGLAFKAEDFSKKGTGLPVIKINELKSSVNDQTAYTEKEFDAKYLLQKGDMLFSWSGSPETSIDIYWYQFTNGWLNQHIFKVISDDKLVDKNFFYYLLKSQKPVFIHLAKQRQTTGLGHVTASDLKELQVSIPESLEEQREIAAILGSLDDKIELLRRENKTLESIAQTLFKEWFVDFRFPGYKKLKIVNGLPEGWKVGRLGDVLKLPSGFAFKSGTFSKDGKYRLVTITNVKNGYFENKTAEGINELPKNMPEYCRLGTGDVLLSLTGEVGRVCIVFGENYVLNQRVSKIEPLLLQNKVFVYFLMRSKEISDQMQSIAVGAVQQNLSPVKALDIETVVPDEKCLQLFSEVANPMFDKLISNIQEIQTLSRLRDDLLNKIFSE
jgi:type I restriction enzyme S subunit